MARTVAPFLRPISHGRALPAGARLMISVFKVLLTVAVIWLVFTVVRYRGRIASVEREARKAREAAKRAAAPSVTAQDMAPCPKCGAYVAAGQAHSCEKV